MIKNTQTVNIDGTALNGEAIAKAFTFDSDDRFSRWVVRPLAILTVLGLGAAMLFASAFVVVLSLALVPFFAVSFWAMKKKVERDLANADPVVDTQIAPAAEPDDNASATT